MTLMEERVRALCLSADVPPMLALSGFPVALLSLIRERWRDLQTVLSLWTEGEAILVARGPVFDRVQAVPVPDLRQFVETLRLPPTSLTLAIVRQPLAPGELLLFVTDGQCVSAPRLRFLGGVGEVHV